MVLHAKELSEEKPTIFQEKRQGARRKKGSAQLAPEWPLPTYELDANLLFCVREAYEAKVFMHGDEKAHFNVMVRETTAPYPSTDAMQDSLNEMATAAIRHAKTTWQEKHLSCFKSLVGARHRDLKKKEVDELAANLLQLTIGDVKEGEAAAKLAIDEELRDFV